MSKLLAAHLLLIACLLANEPTVSACTNPYSRQIVSYLPGNGAEDVPLNAKIFIDWAELHYSEDGLGYFGYMPVLREKDGKAEVEATIQDDHAGGGWPDRGVYTLAPASPLKPNTTYELHDSSSSSQTATYSFTTGTEKQTSGGSFAGITSHTVSEKAEPNYSLCEPTGFVGACPTSLHSSWTYPVHATISFATVGTATNNASLHHYRLLRVEKGADDVLLDSISLAPSAAEASFDFVLSGSNTQCVKVIAESITGDTLDNESVVCFSRDDATEIVRNANPDISNYYCDTDDGMWKQKATVTDPPVDPPIDDPPVADDPEVDIRTRGCSATPTGNAPLALGFFLLVGVCILRRR